MTGINQPQLARIQVGLPRQLPSAGDGDLSDKPWATGFYKQPIDHAVRVTTLGITGDGQADLVNHGGVDKAICVYPLAHYPHWQGVIGCQLSPAAFGENFTVERITEADVCIGDVWRVGDNVIVQVSQPRQPCWKLARRWQRKTLALEVQESGKTGWYFRVLEEGEARAGVSLTLIERPHPDWSVARANHVMHIDKHSREAAAELAALPELSASWQHALAQRVNKGSENTDARLNGARDAAPLRDRDKRS